MNHDLTTIYDEPSQKRRKDGLGVVCCKNATDPNWHRKARSAASWVEQIVRDLTSIGWNEDEGR